MKTKDEIIRLYINDLKNLVTESPARENRIIMLESELAEQEQESFKTAEEVLKAKLQALPNAIIQAMYEFARQSKPLPSDEIWKHEYDCAVKEIMSLEKQLKDAENEIQQLNNEIK